MRRQQQIAERHGDRLASRQPVDAVHEVEEIDEPQPGQAREKALQGDGNAGNTRASGGSEARHSATATA